MRSLASLTLLRTQTDDRLVDLVRAGHERAFEAIVERYRRELMRACRRILPDARAEDALQHTFLAAWTALSDGTEVVELRAWLHRIARNTSLNALRVGSYDYDELRESLSGGDVVGDEAERRAIMRQTLAAVAALPDNQREALLRTAFEGSPQEEIARDLGLSGGAVRMLVHRARAAVRTAVTAITPLPIALWLAAARMSEPLGVRIAEAAAGAGSVGISATLAKAGAVVVIGTGAAVGTPIALDRIDGTVDGPRSRSASAATASPSPSPSPSLSPAPARVLSAAAVATATAEPVRERTDDRRGRRARGRGGDDDADDRRGRGRGGSDRDRDDGERRGRGGDDDGERDARDDGDDRGSSGPGPSGGGGSGSGERDDDDDDRPDRSGPDSSGPSGGGAGGEDEDSDDDGDKSGSGGGDDPDDDDKSGSGGDDDD